MVTVTSEMFEVLAASFEALKEREKTAIEMRRKAGEELLALPEVKEHAVPSGTVSYDGEGFIVRIAYKEAVKHDIAAIAKALGPELMERIFPPKPTFSQSGLNALLKELEGKAVTSASAGKQASKIQRTLAAHATSYPAAAQIEVKRK